MSIFSTGPIENNPVSGIRPTQQVTVKITNKNAADFSTISIQGFALDGTRTLYVSELFSVAPNQVVTKTYFANLNAFEFVFTTGGDAEADTDISVWGKNAAGQLVTAHRLVSSELLGDEATFQWGEETSYGQIQVPQVQEMGHRQTLLTHYRPQLMQQRIIL